jgi:lipopolysaccharide/colanic/teichoic acid biosynthesis glycosyltransferase/NDP-sugar pyrophosphorylase family protein
MKAQEVDNIKAVIAAGGIKSFSVDPIPLPKALFPVLNRPALSLTLRALSDAGIAEAFITTNADTSGFERLTGRFNGLTLNIVPEEYPRGTAGCLKPIQEKVNGSTIVLVLGSLLLSTKDEVEEILRFHKAQGADVTVGLLPVKKGSQFAEEVILSPEDEIKDIRRRHAFAGSDPTMKTSGLYVMEPHVLDCVREYGYMDLNEQLLPKLRANGLKVVGWKHNGSAAHLGSVGDYLRTNFDFLKNLSEKTFPVEGYKELRDQVWVGRNVSINPSATLVRPVVIGDNVVISENVTVVGPCVIGERCNLASNSFVRESVVWPDSAIPARFEVDRCLVSGKDFGSAATRYREMILVEGAPLLNGIGAALAWDPKTVVRKAPRKSFKLGENIYALVKRTFDIAFSLGVLICSLPLFAVIAALVKLDSRGPAFFVQTRSGKNGKPFNMIKFRTMVENSEELKPSIQHLNQSDGPMFKIFGDPRETRVGRLLRATNLDEIPQFINVLLGDMSLVGPRPLAMCEMRYNPHWRDARLTVKPGITGLWQIYGKDRHFFHDWIRYDLQYVDERSLWLDIKVVILTLLKILKIK